MKKLSSFQLILLTVFGSLGVAAVMIFALGVSGGANSNVGAVTIWGTFDESRMNAVIRAAADTDDRLIQVEYVQKDPATFDSELVDALAAGRGPDLFVMRDDAAVFNAAKTAHIAYDALSQSQFRDTFIDAAVPFLGDDGVIAVPFVADPLVLYWNKDLMAQAGYTTPPRYWDEFFGLAQKFVQKSDGGTILLAALPMGEYQNILNAKDILATLILQAGGPITGFDSGGKLISALAPQGNAATAQQASLDALRFYTGFANPAADYYSWNRSLPEARQMFAQAKAATYVGHASEQLLIKQANPNINLGIAPLPQIRDSEKGSIGSANVYGFAIPRTSKNPLGAKTVAYLLAAPQVSVSFATVLNMSSALRSVVAVSTQAQNTAQQGAQDPLSQILAKAGKSDTDLFNSQAAIARAWIDPNPGKTDEIFRGMIEDTTSGSMKINDVLSRADKQLAQILEQ